MRLGSVAVAIGSLALLGVASIEKASPQALAERLFFRLAGKPLALYHPRRAELVGLAAQKRWKEAARIATDEDSFYHVTLRHWSSVLTNRAEDSYGPLTDLDVMVMGLVRDDRDFREILTGDFTYVGPPTVGEGASYTPEYGLGYYFHLERTGINLRQTLRRIEPQWEELTDAAGALTTATWAVQHLNDGTNRRPVEFAFRAFLCQSMSELADGSTPDDRVRRDVDRSPGGNFSTYTTSCRNCHAGLDALSGAFAYFRRGEHLIPAGANSYYLIYRPAKGSRVVQRMNRNGNVYPQGHITVDDSWENRWSSGKNAALGWRGELKGKGVKAFGQMLAQSRAFSSCMAKRVFASVCLRQAAPEDEATLHDLASGFEASGYRLRELFENTALLPQCLGEGA